MTIAMTDPIQVPAATGWKASIVAPSVSQPAVADAGESPGANAGAWTRGIHPRMMKRPDARGQDGLRCAVRPASQILQLHHARRCVGLERLNTSRQPAQSRENIPL